MLRMQQLVFQQSCNPTNHRPGLNGIEHITSSSLYIRYLPHLCERNESTNDRYRLPKAYNASLYVAVRVCFVSMEKDCLNSFQASVRFRSLTTTCLAISTNPAIYRFCNKSISSAVNLSPYIFMISFVSSMRSSLTISLRLRPS